MRAYCDELGLATKLKRWYGTDRKVEIYIKALGLLSEGATQERAATESGCGRKTLYRVIKRLNKSLGAVSDTVQTLGEANGNQING